MQSPSKNSNQIKNDYSTVKITVTYALFGILWILLSDKLLLFFVKNAETFYKISIYKGWLYIAITAVLLYFLIKRSVGRYFSLSNELLNKVDELKRTETLLTHKIDALTIAESKLSLTETRYRMVLESVKSGVWDYDIANDTIFFSPRYYTLTGRVKTQDLYPFDDFMDQIHPNDQGIFLKTLQDYFDKKIEIFQLDFRLQDVYGNYLWISSAGKAIWEEDLPIKMVGSLMDVTTNKADQERIIELAYFDTITKLPNKAKLEDFTNTWLMRPNRTLALIYLDIDNFKMINDALGHKLGDNFLVQISERLKKISTQSHMISRIGGDEFCFVITHTTDKTELQNIAEGILDLIRAPWYSNEREFHITGSIGIAIAPEHGDNLDTLLKKADTAMYASKNEGRNQCTLFHEHLHDVVMEYMYLQSNMKRALENCEFIIHYQPQFDIKSNVLKGAEALLRWKDPEVGIIPPDRFIGISEKTGFIKHLGYFVIESVFKNIQEWRELNYPTLDISINLSAIQILSNNFIEEIISLSQKYNINHRHVIFEITETVAIDGSQQTIDKLRKLRELGFQIALDDFGINYSSLSYLKRLPLDIIKLDKTFISQLDHEPMDLAISKSVISLAHEIDMTVVAEGVEKISHYEILKKLGCDYGQGYLFSRPLEIEDFIGKYLSEKEK